MIIDKYTNINKVVKHYKSKTFNKKYFYDGTLGAIYKNTETTFKVWSPISTSINLRIYENGTPQYLGGSDVYREYRMVLKRKGVWECVVKGDLEGKYYTYIVSNFIFNNKEIVDPYAKSSGINGLRGMVVDFNKTNPKGWDKVNINKINYDNIVVYETHICDMTNSQTWNGDKTKMRLFTGFFEKNTRYNNVTTGLEHIKELGVNAVQLLPVFDHANEEETDKRSFNWGYNPLNYNVI